MGIIFATWTIDEYHHLITSGALGQKNVELLQGAMVEMSPEGPLHSHRIRQTANVLRSQLPDGLEVSEAHPLTLGDSEPEPDIAVIRAGNYAQRHPGAADTLLVIEFADSSLSKDLAEKRSLYAQAGIEDYWVVDLPHREVVIFRKIVQGDYQWRQVMNTGQIQAITCPDVIIAIASLLGEADVV